MGVFGGVFGRMSSHFGYFRIHPYPFSAFLCRALPCPFSQNYGCLRKIRWRAQRLKSLLPLIGRFFVRRGGRPYPPGADGIDYSAPWAGRITATARSYWSNLPVIRFLNSAQISASFHRSGRGRGAESADSDSPFLFAVVAKLFFTYGLPPAADVDSCVLARKNDRPPPQSCYREELPICAHGYSLPGPPRPPPTESTIRHSLTEWRLRPFWNGKQLRIAPFADVITVG